MKRRTLNQPDDSLIADEPILDISSLIDVCFLLLIYFLVTTTIQPREQDLRMKVPRITAGNPVSIPPMLIEIRKDGAVVVNPGDSAETYENDINSRSLPELKSRLGMLSGMGPAAVPKVLLHVDDEVEQQRYVDVINCLAREGIQDVALME